VLRQKLFLLAATLLLAVSHAAHAANELAIGPKAKVRTIELSINPRIDLNFKTKLELSDLRYRAAMKYPQLLLKKYVPDAPTLGQLEDKKPWWGDVGRAYYGEGQNSIRGDSVQSTNLLNPFLLVSDVTIAPLPKDKVTEQDLAHKKYPTAVKPSHLIWYPQARTAEVTYEKTLYEKEMCEIFKYPRYTLYGQTALSIVNARDLGFNYVYIPPTFATNIHIGSPMKTAKLIPQFMHCGTACGYPGGCNNLSPATDWLDNFMIERVPARIGFSFWIDPPTTGKEPPDMTFIVNYR
jgi:hypothetical protein